MGRPLAGHEMIDNLVGTDLMPFFFANTMERHYRYFLLGAQPHIVERAAAEAHSSCSRA